MCSSFSFFSSLVLPPSSSYSSLLLSVALDLLHSSSLGSPSQVSQSERERERDLTFSPPLWFTPSPSPALFFSFFSP